MLSSLLPTILIAAAPALAAQDSASMEAARLCQRAVGNVAPTGRPELAAALQAAETGKQPPRAAFLRGCQRFAEGRHDKAGDEFERAVKLEDANPVYHFWLARSAGEEANKANPLRAPGLARKARSELERAAALAPGYIDAREGLVEFYLVAPGIMGGSVDKAKAEAAEIRRLNPYRGELAALKIAQRSNDTTTIIRGHEALIAGFPDSASSYSTLAVLYASRRQWEDGWRVVDRWNARMPDSFSARYAIGRMAAESGQRGEQGEQALRAYLGHAPAPGQPSIAAAHWRIGMILEKRGDRDGARRAYQTALRLEPTLQGAKEGLARVK